MNKRKPLLIAMSLTLAACGQSSEPEPARQEPGASPTATDSVAEAATLQRTASPEGATVSFVTPRNGAVVTSPFQVEFRVEGMQAVPAGTEAPGSGHHHILVDTDLPEMDLPIPVDEAHIHFGDGSLASELSLPPGQHTLQLLFADHLHIPHEAPVYSEPITITVE